MLFNCITLDTLNAFNISCHLNIDIIGKYVSQKLPHCVLLILWMLDTIAKLTNVWFSVAE